MTVKYKTVITKAGAEKLAAATVPNGKKVNFTAMAVGDGGGTLPVPDAGQTKLVNEVWRHALNKISQDNKHQNYVIAELLIPPETGGFWMREMGLYDDTGTLIAVGNMAESYKPLLAEGSGRAQTVRMVIMVSDIESVELTIDTSTVMATQDYVDDKLAEHEQSRLHPDATLKEKGFTQLSSATDSTSETLAATPKAVKTVNDDVTKLKNSLGTAAGKNVQESRDDITPGRVLVNGGALALRTVAARAGTAIADASALPANSVSFCYADAAYSPGYEATILDVGGLGGDGYRVQYAASYSDGGKRLRFRTLNADNGYWGSWTNVITNYGGSVEYLNNACYYAIKPEYWQGGGAFANQYIDASAPFFVPGYTTPKDTSMYLPIVKGTSATSGYGFGASVSFGILRSGSGDFGSAIIQILGDSGAGAIYSFNANGNLNVPGQIGTGGNIVAGQGLFESGGLVRVYSSNNPPPQQDLSPYATTAWVNGNFSTQAWTVANFLQGGMRLASSGTATNGNNDNTFAYAPDGAVVTGVQQKTNYTAVQYRYVQYNIGGNWYTAWVA
ncbi:phage tail protein [Enterobacter bugandensis]|uniref:phage tail protein n=1 Tax=Enterobacter bugandensis TaxID=881260 RepID=UPI002005258B|nr:phage tail protein [Enterobacter bugandensis]MCK6697767.1 phage tail protein [Enterobacter bugandensis]MCM7278684.1 phage tail protein [Enterobacter bugandensis]